MDYQTAAALGQNLAGIGDAFMQINNPENAAKARLMNGQMGLLGAQTDFERTRNEWLPKTEAAKIALDGAQGNHATAAAAYENARANLEKGRISAQELQMRSMTDAYRNGVPGGVPAASGVPFTTYSTGSLAGGPDEMQDRNTNMGLSSTGKNLNQFGVAVNQNVYPLGTVFRNGADGQVYIATDTHGNKDPNVIDFYRDPETYTGASGRVDMQVLGREHLSYGTTVDQLNAIRGQYAGVQPQQQAARPIDPAAALLARRNLLNYQAGLANVAGGLGGNDFMQGQGRALGATALNSADGDRSSLALGGAPHMAVAAADNATQLAKTRLTVGGENDRKLAELAVGMHHATGTDGTGTAASAYKDILNTPQGIKLLDDTTTGYFGRTDVNAGAIDPANAAAASEYRASVAKLTSNGVPLDIAINYSNTHHNITALDKTAGNAWLWGGPKRVDLGKFNATPITDAQVQSVAAQYGKGFTRGNGQGFQDALAILRPDLAPNQVPAISASRAFEKPGPAIGGTGPAAATPAATAQTAPAPAKLPGTPFGDAARNAAKKKTSDHNTDYNAATLGNFLRLASANGVSRDDLIASVMTPSFENDRDLAFLNISNSKNRHPWELIKGGGHTVKNLRDAFMDNDALRRADIDPAIIDAYLKRGQPAPASAPEGGGASGVTYTRIK